RRADGTERAVELHSSPIYAQDRLLLYAIIHDVTERQQAEDALRASEAQFRSLVAMSPDATLLVGLDGLIEFCNHHVARLHGYADTTTLIGHNAVMLVAPESRRHIQAGLQRALVKGSIRDLECRLIRHDGTYRPAE